jgi:LAO/AO transport system kinase
MHRPDSPSPIALAEALRAGDREALAQALNLIDDRRPESRKAAAKLLGALQDAVANPDRQLVGVTGPPGAGKSSLGAALISHWRKRDRRVGVLAVDPSSPISGGALLGDRVRMKVGDDDGVFVRSLSNRGEFGGLSAETWPMSLVMLAAFDVVLVETVGVGQREVDVALASDTTCYVAQPGSGDSIQFLKAGILEVPHILVVNKFDMGDVARRTLAEMESSVQREHPDGNWRVPIIATSAVNGDGVAALVDAIDAHHASLLASGDLLSRRRGYQVHWVQKRLQDEFGAAGIRRIGGEAELRQRLSTGDINPLAEYESLRQVLAGG